MNQPNILLILCDDLGARDLACFGSTFYETPALDRLAADGMRFSRAYASCPVCSPTRASLMTGRNPARVGVTQFIGGRGGGRLQDVPYIHELPLEETSIARALGAQGYQTWHVGKWHLGGREYWPDRHGFDFTIGADVAVTSTGYFSPYRSSTISDGPEGEYITDRITDEAIALLRRRDAGRPFFLYLAHFAPHVPIEAPEALVAKYRAKAKAMRLDQVEALVPGEPFPILAKKDWRLQRRVLQSDPVYAAMIENLDANVGRLLTALDDEGLAGNTLVVFTSDNGGLSTAEGAPTCNYPFSEGKGWTYEGGTRVCQIVRWPGVVTPRTACNAPVTSPDLYPTFLQACGADLMPDQHADGVSLLPLLRGGDTLDRRGLFWHYPHYSNQGGTPAAAVVDGPWKLIQFFEDNHIELYHLDTDVSEQHDLAGARPDIARRLHGMLAAWQKEVEALIPQPDPDYEAKAARPCEHTPKFI
ncbi:MAG: sulfatase [Planctomycetes bacterium]|nr:sulfatase [Planctomycetota bacterium]